MFGVCCTPVQALSLICWHNNALYKSLSSPCPAIYNTCHSLAPPPHRPCYASRKTCRLWIFLVGAFCLLLLHWFLGSCHDTDRGHERGLMGLATSSFVVLHLMELVSGRSCLGCSPVKMCCDGHTPQHLSHKANTVFPWFKPTKEA